MLAPSMRVDVKVPSVPDYVMRKPGADYYDDYIEDRYLNVRPTVRKAIIEALGGR